MHHAVLEPFVDHLLAMWALALRLFRLALGPDDIAPHDLEERPAMRAGDLVDPLVAFPVLTQHRGRIAEDRRRTDNDLAIGKGQRAAFAQPDRVAFRADL